MHGIYIDAYTWPNFCQWLTGSLHSTVQESEAINMKTEKRQYNTYTHTKTFTKQKINTDKQSNKKLVLEFPIGRYRLSVHPYWKLLSHLVGRWWPCGYVAVHSCRVHWETVETVEETYDWALTVTSRSLWTTSARRWCRLCPLHWWRGPSTADRQVLRTWHPTSPTGTRSALVWRSCATSHRQSLQQLSGGNNSHRNEGRPILSVTGL